MPSYKVFVALWSRDTEHKLDVDQATRLQTLQDAITEADRLFKTQTATDLTKPIKSIFVAPRTTASAT